MVEIHNKELLSSRFGGHWPSFHDAEIISMRLERAGEDTPYLEVDIHVFEMTKEIDAKGYYVLKNHTRVTFRFCEISLEHLKWFNHQNVLSDLIIQESNRTDKEHPIEVVMPSSYGCEVKLECERIKIVSATSYES